MSSVQQFESYNFYFLRWKTGLERVEENVIRECRVADCLTIVNF